MVSNNSFKVLILHKVSKLFEQANKELEKGSYDEAITLFEESLNGFEHRGNEEFEAVILMSMGNAMLERGDFRKSIKLTSQALAIAKQHSIHNAEQLEEMVLTAQYRKRSDLFASAVENLKLKNFADADRIADQCLNLTEMLEDDVYTVDILTMIGLIKLEQNDYELGVENINRALAITDDTERISELKEIILVFNHKESIRLYELACAVAAQGKAIDAIQLTKEAYSFQTEVACIEAQPATLCLLGQLLISMQRQEEGIKNLNKALCIIVDPKNWTGG